MRMIVLEVLVHVTAWIVAGAASAGLDGIMYKLRTEIFIQCGMASKIGMMAPLIISPSIIRHASFGTFLNIHHVLAVIAIIGIRIHCDLGHEIGNRLVTFALLFVVREAWRMM
jgi:hypothetical protein